MTIQKNIVSLFDESGNAVREFAKAGFKCFCFDIQNENREEHFESGGMILYVKADLFDPEWIRYIRAINPEIIFSFPPCTDLAVSGAMHFKNKLAANPNYLKEAMSLVYLGRDIAEEIGCPYLIENPISRISTIWRKPDYIFHPWEYGGYLPENDTHPRFPEYIAPRDAYPKKTCLWTGNGFVMPEKKPVFCPKGYSTQHKKLGGKSEKTKKIRSETPRGFFVAIANSLKL